MWKSFGSILLVVVGIIFEAHWWALDVLGRLLTMLDLPNVFVGVVDWIAAHPYIAVDIGPWVLIVGGVGSLGLIHWRTLRLGWASVFPRTEQGLMTLAPTSTNSVPKSPLKRPLTLRQIFDTDFEGNYGKYFSSVEVAIPHEDGSGRASNTKKIIIGFQVMYDFGANSKFLSMYIPESEHSFIIAMTLPMTIQKFFTIADDVIMLTPESGQSEPTSSRTMVFSHRAYIYMERDFTLQQMATLEDEFRGVGVSVQFRGQTYWQLHMLDDRRLRVPPNAKFHPS